jgi:sulfite reductase alpha subunit-like flavoprotein
VWLRGLGGAAESPIAFRRSGAADSPLTVRRRAYLWSRLRELRRPARRYRVISARRLDTPSAPNEALPVWEISLEGPRRVRHQVGDTILLRWENDPDHVDELLSVVGEQRAHRRIPIVTWSSVYQPGSLRFIGVRRALREEVEIRVLGQRLAARIGVAAGITPHASIDRLRRPTSASIGPDLVDHLRTSAAAVSIEEIVRLQPRIQPRAYSISRIRRTGLREQIEIIVSAVSIPTQRANGTLHRRAGRATAWFDRLVSRAGAARAAERTAEQPPVVARGWTLRHPWRLSYGQTGAPLVIVVAGTGIAAALCYLRDPRIVTEAQQREIHLVYGVRSWQARGLYQDELLTLAGNGILRSLTVAESRAPSGRREDEAGAPLSASAPEPALGAAFAQVSASGPAPVSASFLAPATVSWRRGRVIRVMREDSQRVQTWVDADAEFYVSGPAPLGPAVRAILADHLRSRGTTTEQLLRTGRLQISVS